MTPHEKRQAVATMVAMKLPVVRACKAAGLSRAAYYKRPADRAERDAEVIDALAAEVARHSRWGFWKCFRRLRLDGHSWNHKRVHRVYCALGLNLPRRTKKRVPNRPRQPLHVAASPNKVWAVDFMHDALYDGRRFRTFNVIDEANRECLAIEVGSSMPAQRVVRVLSRLIDCYGAPGAIRLDNGPELCAQWFVYWTEAKGIARWYIAQGLS